MLPSFDEMLSMSDTELYALLDKEVQTILEQAPNRRKLEILQSQIKLQVRAKRVNYVTIFDMMWKEFKLLNATLNG